MPLPSRLLPSAARALPRLAPSRGAVVRSLCVPGVLALGSLGPLSSRPSTGPSSSGPLSGSRQRHTDSAAAAGMDSQVLCAYSHEGRVATVTLNRPSQLNAMTVAMGEEFQKVVEGLERVADLRAVVLTGSGRAFSAGGDLKFLLARPDVKPADNSEDMRAFYNRFLSIRKLPVPIIAAINGPAVGAGLCIAMACDIRVCAADAKLSLTFCNLGIHPGMGATYFLPRLVGFERAAKMLLTGETVLGREARSLGLVSTAVEDPEHSGATLKAAHDLAAQIAALSPVAVQQTLRTLRQAHDEDLSRALWREADSQALCYGSAEYKESITAFAANMKKAK